MSRLSALVAGTALACTTVVAHPAQAAEVAAVATSAPYALSVDGQVEGLSFTATEANPTNDHRVPQHDFGATPLHPGWGVLLSAPQGTKDADLRAVTRVTDSSATAHAGVSLHLNDAKGPFLYFGIHSGSVSCDRVGGPDYAGGASGLMLAVRNGHEVLQQVEPTATGWSAEVHAVAAGDQATPDGSTRTTRVNVQKVSAVADLAPYGDLFPGAYRRAGGYKVTVTQQLDTVRTYSFLVGGVGCDG
ncbi:hypothetical protein GCM10010492_38720 [Saccharothrix mutabilis subsp. mutabilis]|uniref:Uncharacterized protein n=1 Tax=Saccharothrix mutabilis subsp. mutabilis TaxID=66855 RepID=A0ABN0U1X2_9PSEU